MSWVPTLPFFTQQYYQQSFIFSKLNPPVFLISFFPFLVMCIFGLLCVFHSLQARPSYPLSPVPLPVFLFQWPHFPHIHDKTFPAHFPFINIKLLKPVFCYFTLEVAVLNSFSVTGRLPLWNSSSLALSLLIYFFILKHRDFFLGTYFTMGRVLLFSRVSHLEDSHSIPVQSFSPPRFLEPQLTYDTDWFVSCLCSKSPNTSYCPKSKCLVSMAYKAFSLCNKYLNTKDDHE